MNPISFKANLKIDKNLASINYSKEAIQEYRNFMNHKVIDYATQGDTITLYKVSNKPNFTLGVKYESEDLDEPLDFEIGSNSKTPTIRIEDLLYQTITVMMIKAGINPKTSETPAQTLARALQIIIDKKKSQ